MKKFTLVFFTVFLSVITLTAQNNVQLNIHNKLGPVSFELYAPAANNMSHDFEVHRMQYYISEISIVHDGGTETTIEDLWVFADAAPSETTNVDLGTHDINQVEGVIFHIGVDADHNHLDPASWPTSHPLAPKHPSMHWGWNSGYRFICFEGMGGSSFNQGIELHGLGDDNYFAIDLDLIADPVDGQININVDADFTRVVENISVNTGVLVHGDYGAAKKALENVRDYVFSASQTTSTVDFSEINSFTVFPNPSSGRVSFEVSADGDASYQVVIADILGKKLQNFENVTSGEVIEFNLPTAGIFNVQLYKNGQVAFTRKLIVK